MAKEKREKLKPCPLCGRSSHATQPIKGVWNIGCGPIDGDSSDTCGLVLFGGRNMSRRVMVERWNTRKELDARRDETDWWKGNRIVVYENDDGGE